MTTVNAHLVEILLPTVTGKGTPIEQGWFDDLLTELTKEFGGATSFLRTPGKGLWESRGMIERENIAVIEVMSKDLDPAYWANLRARLETELAQEEIIVRAHQTSKL